MGALDLPDFAEPAEVLALPELHDAASGAWSDYLAGRHTGLLAGLSGRLGLVDLAAHAAHRALDTARFTTRPELDEAAALRYLAWVLVRQGELAEAERIAACAAERLDDRLLARPDADRIGVFGSLLMNAASAAARQGSPGRADDLFRVASAAAARSGVDRANETGILGPRVVAMQAVDLAMDAGEPDRAMQLATQVPDAAGTVPIDIQVVIDCTGLRCTGSIRLGVPALRPGVSTTTDWRPTLTSVPLPAARHMRVLPQPDPGSYPMRPCGRRLVSRLTMPRWSTPRRSRPIARRRRVARVPPADSGESPARCPA